MKASKKLDSKDPVLSSDAPAWATGSIIYAALKR